MMEGVGQNRRAETKLCTLPLARTPLVPRRSTEVSDTQCQEICFIPGPWRFSLCPHLDRRFSCILGRSHD